MRRRPSQAGWRFAALLAVTSIVALTAPPGYAASGDLDSTFGAGGKVTTTTPGFDRLKAVAIQADGKIVAVGQGGGTGAPPPDFRLARYKPDGSLDDSFGSCPVLFTGATEPPVCTTRTGTVTTDFGGLARASGVAIQADGKIVVAGFAESHTYFNTGDFALARYEPDGSLDESFGSCANPLCTTRTGKVTTSFGDGPDEAKDVAIDGSDKIVIAGTKGFSTGVVEDFALARYNSDGTLDTSFDEDGKVTTDFHASDGAEGVAIQPDGKVVAAGFHVNDIDDFAVARYNTNGSLDSTFGTGGKVTTDFKRASDFGDDVAIQPNGNVVVVGSSGGCGPPRCNTDFALARYRPDGGLDKTFGTNGKVTTDFKGTDLGLGVAIQTDKIVAVGFTIDDPGPEREYALARYNTNGRLDDGFGIGGKVTTDFGSGIVADEAEDVAIDENNKIVAAGGPQFSLARYLP